MKIIKFLLMALFCIPLGLFGMLGAVILGLTIIGLPFAAAIFASAIACCMAPFAVFAEEQKTNADIVKAIEANTRARSRER